MIQSPPADLQDITLNQLLTNRPNDVFYLRDTKRDFENGNGPPLYVGFTDLRRKGAAARLVNFTIKESAPTYHYSQRRSYCWMTDIVVEFDSRPGQMTNFNSNQLKWLPHHDHSLGTVWAWDPTATAKPKAEPRVVKDHLGEEVKPEQFICFVHRSYKNINLRFGSVTRITPAGTVFVKTIKLNDRDRSEEVRCLGDELVIVNDKLLSRLTLARLSTR